MGAITLYTVAGKAPLCRINPDGGLAGAFLLIDLDERSVKTYTCLDVAPDDVTRLDFTSGRYRRYYIPHDIEGGALYGVMCRVGMLAVAMCNNRYRPNSDEFTEADAEIERICEALFDDMDARVPVFTVPEWMDMPGNANFMREGLAVGRPVAKIAADLDCVADADPRAVLLGGVDAIQDYILEYAKESVPECLLAQYYRDKVVK